MNRMIEELNKRLGEITIDEVREIVRRLEPAKYNKWIVLDGTMKREDIIYWNYDVKFADREQKELRVPLFRDVAPVLKQLEKNASADLNEKKYEDEIFSKLLRYEHSSYGSLRERIPGTFDFPLDEENGEIKDYQRYVYFPSRVHSGDCERCSGNKYITCPKCGGKHQWDCPKCYGDGKIDCKTCKAEGKVPCKKCKGSGELKCSNCNGRGDEKCSSCWGKGTMSDGTKCPKCRGKGEFKCSKCAGKGIVACHVCNKTGKIVCPSCNGQKRFICKNCNGTGKITCDTCYGDPKRYGLVNCPTCKTAGKMGYIPIVSTDIRTKDLTATTSVGGKVEIPEEYQDELKERFVHPLKPVLVYKNVNGKTYEIEDEGIKKMAYKFEEKLAVNRKSFPLIIEEKINATLITCIQVTFQHMFTKTKHDIVILDYWGDPELIYLSEPEELKPINLTTNFSQNIGRLFSKLFKTKKYWEREDRKSELLLLIYLAKVDGIMEDQEKIIIMEKMDGMNFLSPKERKRFYDLMNMIELPPITPKDINFSSPEKAYQVLQEVEKLAAADGEVELSEKKLLKKLKQVIDEWVELKNKKK